jgi:predicted MarR family transcription regulator
MSAAGRGDRRQRERSGAAGPIVSSAHLVSAEAAESSEFEFGLIIVNNAFQRWVVRCMAAAGVKDLGPLDVLVLHTVNHRGRAKRLADICFVLNIEDSHTVGYSLKKLARLGLVGGERRGKEMFYATSPAGRQACLDYRAVREQCLIRSFSALGHDAGEIRGLATLLRALSGLYDQAARAATSL